jgi:hypothetical protein
MTAVIGTPMDVTIEELAIESFYPADEGTARVLWALRAAAPVSTFPARSCSRRAWG